ncbi:MAG TPA: GGDEF domain-containing protein [Phycisphaerales bacterium]|nr:GGDEF domain-containing protein [Phycisphaerales bacterium]
MLTNGSRPEGGLERGVSVENGQSVRVILVGRTGLDAALRLDPEIELVRVSTPLEAVAELASSWDEEMAARSVVVVSPDTLKALGTKGEVGEFVTGLKNAEPKVVVLASTKDGGVQGFDGSLSPDMPGDEVRRFVRGEPATEANGHTPRPVLLSGPLLQADAPTPETDAAPKAAAPVVAAKADAAATKAAGVMQGAGEITTGGDLELVQQLIRGKDILPPAVMMLRERLGDDTAEFVQVAEGVATEGAVVAFEGQVYGEIRTRCEDKALVALQARWLGSWLRLRDQQNQLKTAAFTDALTGAYNRRYFERFLASAIEQARGARRNVTVMVFDIDDFKTYNDRYGHEAGDEILRETVKLMRSTIRPTDRVCRIGGDEFAVIFYEPEGPRVGGSQHPSSVFDIAQRFQQKVQQHKFPKMAGLAQGALTVSGGLATFPWDGLTVEDLQREADKRALASKRQGKNAITLGVMPEPQ